ncbi:hypothetical protein V8G54_014973 [Vigna mungo]|uniref:Uncharacterized protein n=1 Tax=Vigna mungo TaxID=3915 RepID=A0AAQ3RZ22_VIGMU
MDDGDPSLSDKEEENDEEDVADILLRIPIVDAPILVFVCFHKAFRSELDHLRLLAETASLENEPRRCRQLILQLQRSITVIFLALDAHVKNVVCAYSLEHNSTSELFGSVFHFLEELMVPKENISKLFQELVYCIGILQTYIYKHMLKEEKQVAVCNFL